jgi:hypothetical protein
MVWSLSIYQLRNSLKFINSLINPALFAESKIHTLPFLINEWVHWKMRRKLIWRVIQDVLENQGIGIGLFQQKYGLLQHLGSGNFNVNVYLSEDNLTTLGLNPCSKKVELIQVK